MGLFDTFEQAIAQAINAQVHEEMKPSFQLLDDRIVALEKGKVQSTFTGDVANALTEDQNEAVVRIISETVSDEVENAINNGAAESAIETMVESAVENYVEYNVDVAQHVQDWMDYNFDAESLVQQALDDNTDFGNMQTSLSDLDTRLDDVVSEQGGLFSKVEDLEALADSMDKLTDEVADMKNSITPPDVTNDLERLENKIDEYAEGTIGYDEVTELRHRMDNLELAVSDIQEAIRSFGQSL